MKALILAAGLGTRLRPYTLRTPKPLFPIDGVPLIDRIVRQLAGAGCDAVMVNTHHLSDVLERHIRDNAYPIPVTAIHEPEILGTAGAIKNVAGFWDSRPFMVINSDILFDLDLAAAYQYHLSYGSQATLILWDDSRFNTVRVDPDYRILGFMGGRSDDAGGTDERLLTFLVPVNGVISFLIFSVSDCCSQIAPGIPEAVQMEYHGQLCFRML